jgi:hypothetical protein
MVPKIDFGHFYKFVASVGLLVVFLAFAVPWFVTQSLASLDLSERTVAELTPTARGVIALRQALLSDFQQLLPWISGGLLALGLACLIWGLVGWRKRQAVQDSGEDLKFATERVQFNAMTNEQVEEKQVREVQEAVRADSAVGSASATLTTEVQSPPTEEQRVSARQSLDARIEALRAREDMFADKVAEAFSSAFVASRNVSVTDSFGPELALDLVLDPIQPKKYGQVGFDLRTTRQTQGFMLASDWLSYAAIATKGLAPGPVYTGNRGRPPVGSICGIVVIVVEQESMASLARGAVALLRKTRRLNSVLRRPVGVILMTAQQLKEITPAALRECVSLVWRESGDHFAIVDLESD